MTDLAKLVVKLEAESAKLHKDLDKANNKLKKFEDKAGKASKALKNLATVGGAAIAATTGALLVMSKNALETADRIGKLSVATGQSTEMLSRYSYMAELTGSNFEILVKGYTKLQRSMYDANNGLATQQRAFDDLGVSVIDNNGHLKKTDQVIGDVADAFLRMEDGAKKGALAQIIFGRNGRDMIPFLNQGRDGIKAMADEADALGVTMDNQLTAAAERTNDNLSRLNRAMEGVFLRVMAQAIPRIEELSISMVAWSRDTDNVNSALTTLTNTLKSLATAGIILKAIFSTVGKIIGGVAAGAMLAAQGEFKLASLAMSESMSDAHDSIKSDMDNIKAIWKEAAVTVENQAPQTAKAIASPITQSENIIEVSIGNVKTKLKTLEKTMQDAAKKSADISKEFAGRFDTLTAQPNNVAEADIIDVGFLENKANQALVSGDIDTATASLRHAFDVLDAMKENGTESSLVLEGLGESLKRVGDRIADANIDKVKGDIQFDTNAMLAKVGDINDAMQAVLDASPLKQTISFDQVSPPVQSQQVTINPNNIPDAATQRVQNNNVQQLQPMNITMPDGSVLENVYTDSASANQFERQMAQKAAAQGARR